jgi:hypothetical protein
MSELLARFCVAVEVWDERCGATEGEGTGAWYVLGCVLDRPQRRVLVERELQDIPTAVSLRLCLTALIERGSIAESELISSLIQSVDAQLEALSEDHTKIIRWRRRWLAGELKHPEADRNAAASLRASLDTQAVWEEMRRARANLVAWRDLTAGIR